MLERFKDLLKGELLVRNERVGAQYRKEIESFLDPQGQQKKRTINVDFNDIVNVHAVLPILIMRNPSDVLPQLNTIFQEVVREILPDGNSYVDVIGGHRFRVRIYNVLQSPQGVRELRSESVKHLIETSGVITKATEVKPMVIEAVFQCLNCSTANNPTLIRVPQEEVRKYRPPSRCTNNSCHGTPRFKFRDEYSIFIDYQEIRIQENPEDVKGGDMPQSIPVIVTDLEAGMLVPGDRCTVTGVLRMTPDFPIFKYFDDVPSFSKYVECIHIEVESGEVGITLTTEDVVSIQNFVRDESVAGTLYETLKKSIAPAIYGIDDVKEGCMYALFGGVRTAGKNSERGDSHILLIGDPATAKGSLLTFLKSIIPRGMYTSGEGTSSAGLLAAVTQKKTGAWILEAGVLVLCDQGVALIDELTKMDERDREKLHTAMEQQTFSVAKAGIVTSLNCRTTIIAAANPKWGRYNKKKTWIENINLPPTIVSRFDLIYLLTDDPNLERDERIAYTILKRGKNPQMIATPVEGDFLKKYIYFARKNCQPVLTDEADQKIMDWYTKTRKTFKDIELPPVITPRQLQAIKRLATARAKIRLAREATVADVDRILELYAKFLRDVAYDPETGELDIDLFHTGISKSQREQTDRILGLIQHLAKTMNLELVSFDLILENLKNQSPNSDPEKLRAGLTHQISLLKGEVRNGSPPQLIEPFKDGRYKIVS